MQYVNKCKRELYSLFVCTLFYVFFFTFGVFFLVNSSYGLFLSFVHLIIYCFGARRSTLMSILDGLDPYTFRGKMEKRRSRKEEMEENVLIFRQNEHTSFVNNIFKILFSTLYLDLACKQFCLPPGKKYK